MREKIKPKRKNFLLRSKNKEQFLTPRKRDLSLTMLITKKILYQIFFSHSHIPFEILVDNVLDRQQKV